VWPRAQLYLDYDAAGKSRMTVSRCSGFRHTDFKSSYAAPLFNLCVHPRKVIPLVLFPVLLVGLALLITMQVPDVQLHSFFSIFLAAVAISAYFGGWQAGAISSVLSILGSDMFFLTPTWSTAVH
jgi:K+-sensing histidine kinase KdpD